MTYLRTPVSCAVCLGTLVTLAIGTELSAQPVDAPPQTVGVATSFEQLRVIVGPGAKITVTDAAGEQLSGSIAELSSSSLSIIANGGRHDFSERDITAIRERRGDSLGNGALWGLAIGAGLGVLVVSACDCTDRAGWMLLASSVYGGLGAGLGVGIDAMIRRGQLIYQPRLTSSGRVMVAPWLARRSAGVSLSMGF